MNSLIGSLGPFGLATFLTVVLILGTSGGGKVKPLGWGWTLFLSILAGASYAATGWPFSIVKGVVNDLLVLVNSVAPELTLPAIGLCMMAIISWKKLTLRGLVTMGIPLFYIASSADGGLGILAEKIALVSAQLAA
ncbi:hypothetical protein HUT18_11795 [Streptomyces sp. NA04227]|uniref:hypothetical protein n=1 Tax=Streptomyces sp. NA04227 TaxID=2742136 RepID=UPI00159019E7|nr:hypothetical protein [Streptomyces sp. NA04227]QKW06981.1 hypothetical protein HUT18_11795 [Streptomyces sp. NA04227]